MKHQTNRWILAITLVLSMSVLSVCSRPTKVYTETLPPEFSACKAVWIRSETTDIGTRTGFQGYLVQCPGSTATVTYQDGKRVTVVTSEVGQPPTPTSATSGASQ
jgi:hypothetical protein